ncbi:hypothetical protein EBT31_14065 [bacterium]|nr:hypothetical protein [bacterium]NBX50869.1 hypothetical protein [bacterium]
MLYLLPICKKKFLKSVATLCAAFFASAGTAHAAEVVGTTSLEADVSVPLEISDVQITGIEGTIPVKLLVTHGTLSMSTTTGLTFTGPTSGDELYFSGTVANVNAALATLTYTRASTGAAGDSVSEGVWRWVTGPETGTQFWSGDESGSAFGGAYENWNAGEPNESGAGEDCAQFLS